MEGGKNLHNFLTILNTRITKQHQFMGVTSVTRHEELCRPVRFLSDEYRNTNDLPIWREVVVSPTQTHDKIECALAIVMS